MVLQGDFECLLIGVSFFVHTGNGASTGVVHVLNDSSQASASAVEHATLGTLGTLRAALSLGKYSSKIER